MFSVYLFLALLFVIYGGLDVGHWDEAEDFESSIIVPDFWIGVKVRGYDRGIYYEPYYFYDYHGETEMPPYYASYIFTHYKYYDSQGRVVALENFGEAYTYYNTRCVEYYTVKADISALP
ncbi:MAG: hypothetical protein DRJ47_07245 [Thermoprotei archaeon]|nr:MAG: hypothetical protein DRJ47_07245 [Thermoprotei archaeon]